MSETKPSFGTRLKSVKAFNCPSCGGTVSLRASGISVTAACEHCAAIIDAVDPNLQIIQKAEKNYLQSDFEMGVRGELFGVTWEVIGHVRKAVAGTIYRWDEYLLFNPWHGFRFLSKTNGHWIFFKRLNETITGIGTRHQIRTQGGVFNIFNKDTARVESVKGEFYWRLKVGDESRACDYICPPYMLSSEQTEDELNVSLGTYVTARDIEKAFKARLAAPKGIGTCQPPPFRHRTANIITVAVVTVIAAAAIQIAAAMGLPHKQVLHISDTPVPPAMAFDDPGTGSWSYDNGSYVKTTSSEGQTLSTTPFQLDGSHPVRLRTETQLDNAWAEFNLSLVNEKTGQVYAVRQGLERYSGVDGGESWSEGSNQAETYISRVPAGEYRLLIDTDSDVFDKRQNLPFRLVLESGVSDWTNLLLAVLFIVAFPIYVLGRRYAFEAARWSDSAYSPYGASED